MDNKKITKKQIGILLFLFVLLASLPIAVFLTRQQQDIRPRAALGGLANFKLTTSDASPDVGETFTVSAALEITDPDVKVSGVEFRILYSADVLEPNPTIVPAIGEGKPFTDVLVSEVDEQYSDELNSLRVVMVSRRLNPALVGGANIPLATITFKAKADGDVVIQYPDTNIDSNGVPIMQVVGIDLSEAETLLRSTNVVHAQEFSASFEPTDIPDPATDPGIESADGGEDGVIEALTAGENAVGAGTYEDSDPKIKYRKTWQKDIPLPTPGTGTYAQSSEKGAVAVLKFKGTKASVFLRKAPGAGKVFIKVKETSGGKITKTKELFKTGTARFKRYSFDNLNPAATYTIRVRVTGEKNPDSSGVAVGVDKFVIAGESASGTPTPSVTAGGPTLTPVPTGTDDDEDWLTKYDIPIGTKQSLTIQVGGGAGDPSITPNVTDPPGDPSTPSVIFKAKLYGTDENPEIKVRLKINDIAAQITPFPTPTGYNACQDPRTGQYFVDGLTLIANAEGVYTPKPGTSFDIKRNGAASTHFTVTSDGWVPLSGIAKDRSYAISLKGPKHVSALMVESSILKEGKDASQNFDWTSQPLDPGDVPDPSEDNLQNCIVNAADVSLVKNKVGSTSTEDLGVADLDFNDIVNAADIGLLTHTLSTKPDDD